MACVSCSRPLPDGARFCPFCGHEVLGAAVEERRVVTVLFADLVGYTALTEQLDPEKAKRLIDGAFEALVADINAFGGRVDKILGDGILAIFGAPVAHEDDPERAIRASMQMHQSLDRFARGHRDLDGQLKLRIGVNTGEVLVGSIIGTDAYTALGDVVNVASRLQSLAPSGGTYVGDATAALLSDDIVREAIDDVAVRGREQTERVWNVLGRRRRAAEPGSRYRTPFVGRETQRELLQSVMTMVANGRSATVSVTGEAGAGKTRLLNESLDDFPSREVAIFSGVCASYGESNVWAPIASALFRRLDLDTTMPAESARAAIRERAISRYGFVADDPSIEHFIEAVLHLSDYRSKLDDMSPGESRETLFRLIVEGLRRLSRNGPVVLWLDDLQWADPLLIELLHRLTRSLVDRPFLLVTAQRDDAMIDWPPSSDHPITIRMPLDPLTRVEADDLLVAMFGTEPSSSATDQLYERSGGNALFLTELAALAREQPGSTELPGSLRALIAAQLDQLDPGPRAVLDNASVLGASGPISSLEEFAAELGQSFDDSFVATLEDDGLLELDGARWHFRSDVVREVAYQMLTKLVRAQRHAGVAEVTGAQPMVPVETVAHHAATAAELISEIGPVDRVALNIKAQAVQLLLRAVRRSLELGAFSQAGRHATRALDLGPDSAEVRRELLLLRAESLVGRRELQAVRIDAEAALEASVAAGDERHEGKARRFLGQAAQMTGDLDQARRQLSRSVDIFRKLGDDIELAASLRERGFAEVFGGSLADADWLLGEAEALSERLGDRRGRAWVRQHQAWVAFLSGDVELAEQRLMLAAAEFAHLGDRSGSNWVTGLLAYVRFYTLHFEEAEALAHAVRAEAVELGERWSPAMMDSLLASIRLWSGNFVEAERFSRRALKEFRELDDKFGLVQALGPRNRALIALGRDDEAERGIEEALAHGDGFGDLAFALSAAAGAAVHLGLGERAAVMGEQAVEQMSLMGANAAEASVTYALALCQTGRAEEALEVCEQIDITFPYAHAVRALAAAICGDDVLPIADAAAVWSVEGSSYLDRAIADVAAAAAEVRTGEVLAAEQRLLRTAELVHSVGDQTAIKLVAHVQAALLPSGPDEFRVTPGEIRSGWHRVVAGLQGVAALPAG
jgi:class 3 adenylate cyclase/tetratricopeptide (TPR) repeat protein